MVFAHNPKILDEIFRRYSYCVPLSPLALSWGICIALLLTVCVELTLLMFFKLLAKIRLLVP
jgi:hypothetical protein